jgi:putative endopeptidase
MKDSIGATMTHRSMLRETLLVLGCALGALAGAMSVAAESPPLRSGLELSGFDRSVRPQDDLYRFAGGAWLKNTKIPPDRSNYGSFTVLEEQAQDALRRLAETSADGARRGLFAKGGDQQKIGDLYASFMAVDVIEAKGIAPIKDLLNEADEVDSPAAIFTLIGRLQTRGLSYPIAAYVSQDRKQSTRYVAGLSQSGLTMPDREFYLSEEARYVDLRAGLVNYATTLLVLSGLDAESAAVDAGRILELETAMARAHWTRVENRDPLKTYNLVALQQAALEMPAFDWAAFMAGFGPAASDINEFDVRQPSYAQALGELVRSAPIDSWRAYFRYRVLDAYAPFLPSAFEQAHFDFRSRDLRGVKEMEPRWRRGVQLVNRSIGEIAGRAYVEENFKPEARERIRQLVANLREAFDQSIDTLEWMGPETKTEAKRKLASFTVKVGYPDKWRDYTALELAGDELIGNLRRSGSFEFNRQIGRLGGPVDRDEWFMTPQTVNAYYSPPMNEIVFPAAILQPPFFDPLADDAVNYGAIGGVIGHEFSHGFDDSGRRYDGEGNLRDWWTFDDNVRFRERAGKLIEQYSQYQPLEGASVNGQLTLGENIGDLSGLSVAYRAYQLSLQGREAPVIDGFTGPQRFFLGWAQIWRRQYRDEELRARLLTDSHSPSEYRCNGVVSNMTEFHEAFALQPGDALYRGVNERVRIW